MVSHTYVTNTKASPLPSQTQSGSVGTDKGPFAVRKMSNLIAVATHNTLRKVFFNVPSQPSGNTSHEIHRPTVRRASWSSNNLYPSEAFVVRESFEAMDYNLPHGQALPSPVTDPDDPVAGRSVFNEPHVTNTSASETFIIEAVVAKRTNSMAVTSEPLVDATPQSLCSAPTILRTDDQSVKSHSKR